MGSWPWSPLPPEPAGCLILEDSQTLHITTQYRVLLSFLSGYFSPLEKMLMQRKICKKKKSFFKSWEITGLKILSYKNWRLYKHTWNKTLHEPQAFLKSNDTCTVLELLAFMTHECSLANECFWKSEVSKFLVHSNSMASGIWLPSRGKWCDFGYSSKSIVQR